MALGYGMAPNAMGMGMNPMMGGKGMPNMPQQQQNRPPAGAPPTQGAPGQRNDQVNI